MGIFGLRIGSGLITDAQDLVPRLGRQVGGMGHLVSLRVATIFMPMYNPGAGRYSLHVVKTAMLYLKDHFLTAVTSIRAGRRDHTTSDGLHRCLSRSIQKTGAC
jgi:hypothetical protein